MGFELNKATIFDVQKLYKFNKKEKNYWDGYNYHMDISNVKLNGITGFLIICNDDNIIQAVILSIDSNKFVEIHKFLSEKYKALNESLLDFGINFQFIDDDSLIILDTPHINCQMSIIYITNDFLKKFLNKEKEELFPTRMKYKEFL